MEFEQSTIQCRRKGGAVDEAAAARVLAVLAALWRKLPAPTAGGMTDAAAQPQQPPEQPAQQLTQQVLVSALNWQCFIEISGNFC